MCTVTFIPERGKVFLSSNRDEKKGRQQAHPPQVYEFPSGKIMFPKDADAGGTWVACHENGNAIVLLNGGWIAHQPMPPYRKSRGIILLDLMEGATPFNSFKAIKLTGIEPFTAIIWDEQHLFECRWDGIEKHHQLLDETKPYIWSSVTLYDTDTIQKRNRWFAEWIQKTPQPDLNAILRFHQFTGDGDPANDLRMNRSGEVFTVSITSLELQGGSANMHYLDLKSETSHTSDLYLEKPLLNRI